MSRAQAVKGSEAGNGRPALTPRGERTRARLLEAAEAVFADRGFDEASIVQITRGAGVAMGTFYLYFPSKQAIFHELVLDLNHRLRADIATAVAGLAGRAKVERAGFRAFFEFTRSHPGLYRIIRSAEFVDRDAFEAHYERLAAGYIEGLRAAMDDREFRETDPTTLAYVLMGIAEIVGMRWILWRPEGEVSDELLDQVMDIVLHGAAATTPKKRGRR